MQIIPILSACDQNNSNRLQLIHSLDFDSVPLIFSICHTMHRKDHQGVLDAKLKSDYNNKYLNTQHLNCIILYLYVNYIPTDGFFTASKLP